MLTRLKINGFKNFSDVEISFGPFTCIAGTNGVGKSNLFDAIMFLRDLTEFSITEAAARVRDPVGRSGDLQAIFHRSASGEINEMSFESDFIVPTEVFDDFGREAKPSTTFLRYFLSLKYVPRSGVSPERIEITKEELNYIPKSHTKALLGFRHSAVFRESIGVRRRTTGLISTMLDEEGRAVINLHQDGSSGRPFKVPAASSPKTILGGINTESHPTVLAARREMQSWSLLQLEPSALRQPDSFSAESHISENGAHMPSTLLRLGAEAQVANQLAELIPGIRGVRVERDEGRRLNTLMVTGSDRVDHPARALSDGTLRFLALSLLSADTKAGRLICLEEPESGIHPSRIPALLRLLESIAVDPGYAVDGQENALRQVIINTHSPSIVSALGGDSLVVVRPVRANGKVFANFYCLKDTWRANRETELVPNMGSISKSDLLSFLTNEPAIARTTHSTTPTVRQRARELGLFDFISDLA